MTAVSASDLDSLTRDEAEAMAAAVLRAAARESFRRHRNVAAATREASQLVHLAIRLETFARAAPFAALTEEPAGGAPDGGAEA